MRLGYETGNTPFYLRFSYEPYYKGHHLRRSYPPITLLQLQKMIDTNRLNSQSPIDVTTLCNTGLFTLKPDHREFGFQLTDEGVDVFKTKVNIEVQHASEQVIAAIEKNGGVITTSYYDAHSLYALRNPKKWFEKGVPIPERMLPPQDAIEYYTNPKNRGYLADPEAVSHERLALAQKYGYELPEIEKDVDFSMLSERKDPRQIFFGLEPGWLVNVRDQAIVKTKSN
jgi:large subunit ribosomal protein L15